MRIPLITAILGCLLAGACIASADDGPAWALGEAVPEELGKDYTLASGDRFHLEILENRFHAVFMNNERRVVEPPFDTIILRGEEARNRTNDFNLVLSAEGGPILSHPMLFYPPYDFWFSVVIPREGEETEVLPRGRFRQ